MSSCCYTRYVYLTIVDFHGSVSRKLGVILCPNFLAIIREKNVGRILVPHLWEILVCNSSSCSVAIPYICIYRKHNSRGIPSRPLWHRSSEVSVHLACRPLTASGGQAAAEPRPSASPLGLAAGPPTGPR